MSVYLHPQLGEVTLNPSVKARRLSLSVRSGGEIRLTIPRGVSERDALRFLDEKASWAERARERVAKRQVCQTIEPGYATRSHILQLDPHSTREIRVRIADGIIRVSYPAEMRYDEEPIQEMIRKGIEEAWRREAKADLPERVKRLAVVHGFRHGAVSVRNARTRWGSCSPTDDISLSIHLMKLPDHLIDYIILHELCHTKHKNHGKRFHALLDRVTGSRHLLLRKELRNYSTRWIGASRHADSNGEVPTISNNEM